MKTKETRMSGKYPDLRSMLDLLAHHPEQLLETDVEVDPDAELSGVYRHVGAWGTVMRPTQLGPAMVFNNVKGHEGARVLRCVGGSGDQLPDVEAGILGPVHDLLAHGL